MPAVKFEISSVEAPVDHNAELPTGLILISIEPFPSPHTSSMSVALITGSTVLLSIVKTATEEQEEAISETVTSYVPLPRD